MCKILIFFISHTAIVNFSTRRIYLDGDLNEYTLKQVLYCCFHCLNGDKYLIHIIIGAKVQLLQNLIFSQQQLNIYLLGQLFSKVLRLHYDYVVGYL